MKVRYEESIRFKVLERIRAIPGKAILRADISDLATKREISRALRKLIEEKEITKLGYGVYGRLSRLSIAPDNPYLEGGFLPTVREALTRLGIDWEPSKVENEYNSGRSTQVPANPPTKINSRFCRKLTYKNMEFKTERP